MADAPQNVRYRQIRRGDRQGDGKQFQMSAPANPATDGYPTLYDATGNVIAREPRGNTTVVQMADQTGGFILNHLLAFDPSGNAKDSTVLATDVLTSPGGGTGATVGGLGSPYEQIPVGSKDGVNTSFFLDYIPASPPTGAPPVVPFWLFINGSGQSPYTPRYSLAPGSNHLVMAVAPKATDEFWCVYFRGDIAPPPSPISSAVLTMVYTYTPSTTADGFVKLQAGNALPFLYDAAAYTNRTFTYILSPIPAGFGSGLWTVSLEVYGSLFQEGTDVLQLFEIYADINYVDGSTGVLTPTVQAYAADVSLFDSLTSWMTITHVTGDGTNATYTYTITHGPTSLSVGNIVDISGCATAGFNAKGAVLTAVTGTTFTIANTTAGTESESASAYSGPGTYYGSVANASNAIDGNTATAATLTRDHYYPGHSGGGLTFTF